MATPFYQAIAGALQARINCETARDNSPDDTPDAEYKRVCGLVDFHQDRIDALIKAHAPHGSGFDSGTKLDDSSRPNRLVFQCDFHHMNDHGFYCGWSEHQAIITPSLTYPYEIRITGRNRRNIKDYISDTFHHLGSIGV